MEMEAPNCLLRMLHPVQKPDVGFGECVCPRSFPEQRDVAQRGLTIDFFALSHIGDGWDHPTAAVLGFDQSVAVAAPGTPSVESKRIKSRFVMR